MCLGFYCANKVQMGIGWGDDQMDEVLQVFGLVKMPKEETVDNHEI